MEILLDPNIWVGLLTLVVLEIVLGIDNLIFIAILSEKLPPKQRNKARIIGLSLALLMRLMLLSVMSWMIKLTDPLFSILAFSFSGRDLILIFGGFFLLFKGTLEMHERIEGKHQTTSRNKVYASFGIIVAQIVVLDAVFSLDAVITAVGMVDELYVMVAAVVIAMITMLLAAKPLTKFVNAHNTVVILCLGFLLMIGFSLVADGFGFKIPKGYLYTAIAFSVLIELFNQLARRSFLRSQGKRPLRERTAEGILRMLGKRPIEDATEEDGEKTDTPAVFNPEEQHMVSGVLKLAERSIHSIMTPRTDISWINIEDDSSKITEEVKNTPHTFFPVCKGSLDELIGIGRSRDMIADLFTENKINIENLRKPIVVPETIHILKLLDILKKSRGQLVMVSDEFGEIVGLVTPIDIFEAIAGEFPDEDEIPDIMEVSENSWRIDGAADLHHLEQALNIDGLYEQADESATIAGFLLKEFGQLPKVGDTMEKEFGHQILRFEILKIQERRISEILISITKRNDEEH